MRTFGYITITSVVAVSLMTQPALAQLEGSYLGVAINDRPSQAAAAGLVDTDNTLITDLQTALSLSGTQSRQYQGRLDFQDSALSLRGNLYLEGEAAALVPSVTYDLPVVDGTTNVYVGAGYAIVNGSSAATEIGDQNGWVLSVGAETELLPGTILYGNTQYGVNTSSSGDRPVTVQVGVGRSL